MRVYYKQVQLNPTQETDYNDLANKPKINGVDLEGDLSTEQIKITWHGTQAEFDALPSVDPYTFYIIDDGIPVGMQESYLNLADKPSINGQVLTGNKVSSDLNMYTSDEVDNIIASMRAIKVVTALPAAPQVNTMYYVGPDSEGVYQVYLFDSLLNRIDLGPSVQKLYNAGNAIKINETTNVISVGYDDATIKVNASNNLYVPTLEGTKGSATKPVYLNSGQITAGTYELKSTVNSGTANKLAYYSGANAVSSNTSTVGGLTKGIYLNAGVPTEMSYNLNATVNSGTANKLTYYSGTNAISSYASNVGNAGQPIYMNAGVPTAVTKPQIIVGKSLGTGFRTTGTVVTLFNSHYNNNISITSKVNGNSLTLSGSGIIRYEIDTRSDSTPFSNGKVKVYGGVSWAGSSVWKCWGIFGIDASGNLMTPHRSTGAYNASTLISEVQPFTSTSIGGIGQTEIIERWTHHDYGVAGGQGVGIIEVIGSNGQYFEFGLQSSGNPCSLVTNYSETAPSEYAKYVTVTVV